MKIIQKNKDLGNTEFSCGNCQTIFSASRGEYSQVITNDYKRKSGLNLLNKYIATPSWAVRANCPTCGCSNIKYIPTGEPSFETHDPYASF